MMPDLPDKIISIDALRVERGLGKACKCSYPKSRRYILDPDTREVFCGTCGGKIDAFEALERLANHWEDVREQLEYQRLQAKQIDNYKPHLVELREIEKMSQRGKYLPTCPHCHKPMTFREIHYSTWVNAESPELAAKHAQKVLNALKWGDSR